VALVLLVTASILAMRATAQEPSPQVQPGPAPEKRLALVIGNGAYPAAPLRNPVNDARAVAERLRGLGFEILVRENASQREMRRAILEFGDRLREDGGVGLFYFAGHGMQVAGRNYLLPVDAVVRSEREVEVESVDVAAVLARMETAKNRLNIVILDACRDNPFERGFRSAAHGLAAIEAPSGTLVAYATAPGRVARDGDGDHGVYTGALVKALGERGLRIEEMFKRVRQAVQEATGGEQVPWEASSLVGEFAFAPPATPAAAPTAAVPVGVVGPRAAGRIESMPPGATVHWNGKAVGRTPIVLPGVDPGRHQLVLVLDGHLTVSESVDVRAGQPFWVTRTLDELVGTLEVVTAPSGARLELDGVPIGNSPQRLPRVRVGRHRVAVHHPGYRSEDLEVTVEFERTARVEIALDPSGEPAEIAIFYRSLPEYERLKDLLQSGKSGTMFLSTAYSRAGQLRNDGSATFTRATAAGPAARTAYQTGPRQASTTAAAWAPGASGPGATRGVPRGVRAAASPIRRADSAASSIRTIVRAHTSPVAWTATRTSRPA
jgi:hypothetical protein